MSMSTFRFKFTFTLTDRAASPKSVIIRKHMAKYLSEFKLWCKLFMQNSDYNAFREALQFFRVPDEGAGMVGPPTVWRKWYLA